MAARPSSSAVAASGHQTRSDSPASAASAAGTESPQAAAGRSQEEAEGASGSEGDDDDEDDDDDDDEPKLKYTRLTKSLGGVYRNGDAVSCTWVGGDKMIVGTHNGNIHILSLPSLHPLRTYKAHSASITSISVSPPPPPPFKPSASTPVPTYQHQAQQGTPAAHTNIYIGTSSIDGHVCITPLSALLPPPGSDPRHKSQAAPTATREILLKNFSRPLLTVALSPNYGIDKTYLTGGLSTNLILSQHDKPGSKLTSSTVSSSGNGNGGGGWGIGIPIPWGGGGDGGNSGKDVILASGEGAVSIVKFSKESARYVAWACESGIKIMRSHIFLPGEKDRFAKDTISGTPVKSEWKRICAIERPETVSEEMAGVIKARIEWVDRRELREDDDEGQAPAPATAEKVGWEGGKEKLVIGWGSTVWVMNISSGEGAIDDSRRWGWGEILNILQTDCTISGLSLYTPTQLILLAHLTAPPEANEETSASSSSAPPRRIGGISGVSRRTALSPELRIISLTTSEELSADSLMMSRFEGLATNDYHLGVLPATPKIDLSLAAPGEVGFYGYGVASDFLAGAGAGLWAAGVTATTIFSSAASVRSLGSNGGTRPQSPRPGTFWAPTLGGFTGSVRSAGGVSKVAAEPPQLEGWGDVTGRKIYVTSPYDVVFATERGIKDHLGWLLERKKYEEAWKVVDEHPEIINGDRSNENVVYDQDLAGGGGGGGGAHEDPTATDNEDDDTATLPSSDYTDDDKSTLGKSSATKPKQGRSHMYSAAEKEKRRIGELWLGLLVSQNQWAEAGEICGKILGTSPRWEHWVWVFEAAGKIKEITPYIPSERLTPALPSIIYEIVLAHWLKSDRKVFKHLLLEDWGVDKGLFDLEVVADLIRRRVKADEEEIDSVRNRRKPQYRGWKASSRGKDKEEDDEDAQKEQQIEEGWRLLQGCLAAIYMGMKNPREALGCYMRLRDEREVMQLITDYHLLDAVKDDIPALLMLKITKEQLTTLPLDELKDLTAPVVDLLVSEAGHGIVGPERVVFQLDNSPEMEDGGRVLLFFYLRKLWEVDRQLVEESWADLAVQLWAEYDRNLLMEFLKASQGYSLEKAAQICETRNYIPELVHLLSKTGQTKRALFLIIDRLHDVAQAIAFAKQQDEKELWDDLISYSMDKPDFVRGLLENVGVSSGGRGGVEVVKLVRGIPEGMKVDGLKGALQSVLREYAVQWSVAEGVARVLRGEVHGGMEALKKRSRRGVKFEVLDSTRVREHPGAFPIDDGPRGDDVEADEEKGKVLESETRGRMCAGCNLQLKFNEKDTLLSFPCGHVFHLQCLLNPDAAPEDESDGGAGVLSLDTPSALSSSGGRSVGAKVTHAALLKEKLAEKGGVCTVCRERKLRKDRQEDPESYEE
ncbi:hypothetical protein DFH27DRAFT_570591 [Peziza echinospora]|nr:hypothetical protein DFH27DRAFT_570591 [Peziza echinospora]